MSSRREPVCDDDLALGIATMGLAASGLVLKLAKELGIRTVWTASESKMKRWGLSPAVADALLQAQRKFDAGRVRETIERAEQWFIPFRSPLYPSELRHLETPPTGLFVRGSEAAVKKITQVPRMTVVGTRKATYEGTRATQGFVRYLAGQGVGAISGMALGIDSCAHTAALDQGGLTVAVLGCGVDVIYPPRLRWLHRKIADAGVVVSELPPGCLPTKWSFPRRNRLLAALGDAVLVVEGSNTSGALQTARWALDLGRQVFCVPGSIFKETSQGCNSLIYDGAVPALQPERLVEEFLRGTRMERGERDAAAGVRAVPGEQMALPGLFTGDAPVRCVLDALRSGPSSIDRLAAHTGLSVRKVSAALGELEVCGRVARVGAGLFARAP